MSKRKPELLIQDMLDAVEKINSYSDKYDFSRFKEDRKTVDAVVRILK